MDYLNQPVQGGEFESVDTSRFVLPGGIITKDGDTFKLPDGKTLRLQGVNTAETQKSGRTAGDFEAAELGANTQQQIVRDAIVRYGFNKPVFSGVQDEYKREVGDLVNAKGERLSDYLLSNRLADPLMPTQDQMTKIAFGDLERRKRTLNNLPLNIADTMGAVLNAERNVFPLMAKPYTDTAAQYGYTLNKEGKSDFAGPGFISADEDYSVKQMNLVLQSIELTLEAPLQELH